MTTLTREGVDALIEKFRKEHLSPKDPEPDDDDFRVDPDLPSVLSGPEFEAWKEKRFNSVHDPHSGKFASKGGGSGDGLGSVSNERYTTLHTKAVNGGFTYSPANGSSPKEGFSFSPYPERSKVIATKDIDGSDIKGFTENNRDLLTKPDHYVGAWRDKSGGHDDIYLDVSVVTSSRPVAEKLGREHNQKAMWDLNEGKEIPLGGTGTDLGSGNHKAIDVPKAEKDAAFQAGWGEMIGGLDTLPHGSPDAQLVVPPSLTGKTPKVSVLGKTGFVDGGRSLDAANPV